jgi:hypothetical protein
MELWNVTGCEYANGLALLRINREGKLGCADVVFRGTHLKLDQQSE